MQHYAQANRDIWLWVEELKISRLTPAVICDEDCVMSADTQHWAGGSMEDGARRWNHLSVSILIWSAMCTYVF